MELDIFDDHVHRMLQQGHPRVLLARLCGGGWLLLDIVLLALESIL